MIRDRARRRLWLCQDAYIAKMAAKFGLANQAPIRTPMIQEILTKYEGKAEPYQIARYQSLVGSCNYPAVITRPDVAYTSSKLSERLQNPGPIHIAAAERCVRYLDTTRY